MVPSRSDAANAPGWTSACPCACVDRSAHESSARTRSPRPRLASCVCLNAFRLAARLAWSRWLGERPLWRARLRLGGLKRAWSRLGLGERPRLYARSRPGGGLGLERKCAQFGWCWARAVCVWMTWGLLGMRLGERHGCSARASHAGFARLAGMLDRHVPNRYEAFLDWRQAPPRWPPGRLRIRDLAWWPGQERGGEVAACTRRHLDLLDFKRANDRASFSSRRGWS